MRNRSVKYTVATLTGAVALAISPLSCRTSLLNSKAGDAGAPASTTDQPKLSIQAHPAFAQTASPTGKIVSISDVAERVVPSVVNIASTKHVKAQIPELPFSDPFFEHFFGPFRGVPDPEPRQGLGSGVIVAEDVILTNNHVVEGADELRVTTADKRELEAEIAGTDPRSDLAVLRIKGKPQGLKPIEFGSSQALRLGDVVLAVGNPFGVGQTVTMGIVSAKGRADLGIVDYEDFIQTDAAINPGNSGGALVNMEGKLVGVNTAILSRTGGYMGVGFAIPSDMIKPIMQSLLEHGKVTRGWLGVSIQDVDPELASALKLPSSAGVLISDVAPSGPAARAGVQRGDVVTRVDGKPIDSTGRLRNLVAAAGAKRKVNLEIIRSGKSLTLTVELGEMPNERRALERADASPKADLEDITVSSLTPDVRQRFGIPGSVQGGVVVTQVERGSAASAAGLRERDVVLEVDRQRVQDAQQFTKLWKDSKRPTLLLVWRNGSTIFLVVKR